MKKEPRKPAQRICLGCSHDFGVVGPLDWNAEVHLMPDGKLEVTCSKPCRTKLGLKERRT